MNRYPRDMIGYGANPPDPKWPGGAKIALQIVLNYEEGGENCVLHGDAASEAFLLRHRTSASCRLGRRPPARLLRAEASISGHTCI